MKAQRLVFGCAAFLLLAGIVAVMVPSGNASSESRVSTGRASSSGFFGGLGDRLTDNAMDRVERKTNTVLFDVGEALVKNSKRPVRDESPAPQYSSSEPDNLPAEIPVSKPAKTYKVVVCYGTHCLKPQSMTDDDWPAFWDKHGRAGAVKVTAFVDGETKVLNYADYMPKPEEAKAVASSKCGNPNCHCLNCGCSPCLCGSSRPQAPQVFYSYTMPAKSGFFGGGCKSCCGSCR